MKKIYFVGIKGVGMAALAVIAKEAGFDVRGSDVAERFITDEVLARHNILVDEGFDTHVIESFITPDTIVIATAAHGGQDNPQVVAAQAKNTKVLSYGQAVGKFQSGELLDGKEIQGISVAGAHGKTTTAAMLATTLKYLGTDPSFLIGTSDVSSLGDAGHLGTGKYFVVEADEYVADVKYDRTSKFLYQYPFAAIVTNIDFDHPDVFENIDAIKQTFKKFAQQVQETGILCFNGDTHISQEVFGDITTVHKITFGQAQTNEYVVTEFDTTENGITFAVVHTGDRLGEVHIPVLGTHNALNALAVIALLHALGFEFEKIASALSRFMGSKRRLELIGTTQSGVVILDDYAHHPSEIRASLSAIRAAYPDKKVICIFQPHTFSRTKAFIDDFAFAFEDADAVLLLPIFASAREGQTDIQAQDELYEKITKNGKTTIIDLADVVEYCTKLYASPDTILVTMGAGDVYKIAYSLLASPSASA